MEKPLLRNEIVRQLFDHEDTRLVVVENNDDFLLREDVRWELSYLHVVVESGDSLALRILYETRFRTDGDVRFIFVTREDFKVAPDIVQVAEQKGFVASRIFKRYKWNVLKDASLPTLEWMLSQKTYTNLSEAQTSQLVRDYEQSYEANLEKIDNIEHEWRMMLPRVDFNKPSLWMYDASKLLCRALAINQWERMSDEIEGLNADFQQFLQEKYLNIVSSSTPPKDRAPRIVTQVLPFIAKQDDKKTALFVIDGMNCWQAVLLGEAIEGELGFAPKYDYLFSWLPSVTELSRQAIFRGGTPDSSYPQSPHNEEKLWKEFWNARKLPEYNKCYQYEGILEIRPDVIRQAYVTTALDKMMHSSNNHKYLYRSTKLWVEEEELLANIKSLRENGFTIFITTDHGNIETEPMKQLSSSEKVGANRSLRHITLSEDANPEFFDKEWEGKVMRIAGQERTFYPVGHKVFSGVSTPVTHGGTHWLEVLIPFITIR